MDTRIIIDCVRRWLWLWSLVVVIPLGVGFGPMDGTSFLLAMPMIYLVIPMSVEFRKQGPMWVHRTLPIRDEVLTRTGWLLAVVLPVAAVVVSLLPAVAFAGISGKPNLASGSLLPLMAGGLLWTSANFTFTALGSHTWRSKSLQVMVTAGAFVVVGGLVLLMMKSAQYWGHQSVRTGLILGAGLLAPFSYLVSPYLLQVMVRNHAAESTARPGEGQALYAESLWDRMMAIPFGRTLLTGVWLLAFLFWMGLFYALLSERKDWWNAQAVFAIAPVGMQMMAMFLFLYAFAHVASLRGMAVLPISRLRRTLTVVSLPLAAAIPFILCATAQMMLAQATSAELLRLSVMILYSLVTAYACLALCLRIGFMPAILGLMVFMFIVMIRVMLAGRSGVPELSAWDGVVGLALLLVAGLWIHQILDRNPGVYRRHWLPAGLRRG